MSSKPVTVKRLAAELRITSRHIIDRCREEGVVVQNSISRLSPEIEGKVRTWFADQEAGDSRSALPHSQG